METGTIIVQEEEKKISSKVAIYTRVSANENKKNLHTQAQRLTDYCMAKGWKIDKIVKEIGSGVNDNRPKLKTLLSDDSFGIIVVEHKGRLTR